MKILRSVRRLETSNGSELKTISTKMLIEFHLRTAKYIGCNFCVCHPGHNEPQICLSLPITTTNKLLHTPAQCIKTEANL